MIARPAWWMATLTLCILAVGVSRAALSQETAQPATDQEEQAPGHAAASPGIHIHWARTLLKDEVYYLDAAIEYRLGQSLEEALLKGIVVPIIVNIEVVRVRDFLWNETTAALEQRYSIEYHALTQQYIVRNLNISTQSTYPSLEAALGSLGQIVGLPLIDSNLLAPNEKYVGRIQSRIEVDALPVPLRLLAIVSSEWRLSSNWYEWLL